MEKRIISDKKLDWDFSNQGKVKLKKTTYVQYYTEDHAETIKFINLIMSQTDEVYFSIDTSNIEDLRKSKWSFLCDIAIELVYTRGIMTGDNIDGEYLLFVKKNKQLHNFLLEKKSIFDFDEYDITTDIKIEDPTFIKNGEVFCYTLSHEKICVIEEKLYDDLMLII